MNVPPASFGNSCRGLDKRLHLLKPKGDLLRNFSSKNVI
ncbi:unnamed protein product [Strongylus vulgaris]|uniref:Uncharacterized protein n=1 Tax=Strongylus vulgaris TaxID=40348 RepID=A0A3P7LTV0_STRVU|nr:unnamed protein product [Strongylus vulgaris]